MTPEQKKAAMSKERRQKIEDLLLYYETEEKLVLAWMEIKVRNIALT